MRNLIAVAFLFLLSSPLLSQSFREQFTEANLLTEDGYYGLAIPIWQDLLKENEANANLNYKLGRCFLSLGLDRERALPFLIEASKDVRRIYDPFSSDFEGAPVETYFYLAKAYHIETSLDSAEKYYTKFLTDASKKHYLRPDAEKGLEMLKVARELMAAPVKAQIVNIGSPINSEFAEYSPIVAFDENTLYFTSRRVRDDGTNEGQIDAESGLYFEDMYVSYRSINGDWMEPELLDINVADKHSSIVSMSPDGRKLYIYKTFQGIGNIYVSEFLLGEGWTFPSLLGSNINSDANEYFAVVTADEQRLYFVSDRKGGLGGKDIWYVNKLPNGDWGKAINMGAPINTEGDEDAPYMHPDGRTMYFSSNGHRSMGGYDIFFAQQDAEGNWSQPKNLGYPINTTDDDHSYISTPNGRRAYYSSKTSNSLGSTDIYVIEYEPEEKFNVPVVDMSKYAVVKGWIFAAPGEKLPPELDIEIRNYKTGELEGIAKPVERNGSFVFIIPSGAAYNIDFLVGEKNVYHELIDIPSGVKYQELQREVFLPRRKSVKPAMALRDNVLGKAQKWRLAFANPTKRIPIGTKVFYLDQNEQVIDSVMVSKDGYFEFKPLARLQGFRLKPVMPANDTSGLTLVLLNAAPSLSDLELQRDGELFVEHPSEGGEQPIAANQPVSKPSSTPMKDDRADEAMPPKTLPKRATSKVPEVESGGKNDDCGIVQHAPEQGIYVFNVGFNVHQTFDQNIMRALVSAIKKQSERGTVVLTMSSSASRVPTGIKGGNKALAEMRLENGNRALLAALRNAGVDMNKISTKTGSAKICGPSYEQNGITGRVNWVDYQYFMVVTN